MQDTGQVDKKLDPKVLLLALIGSVCAPFMHELQLLLKKTAVFTANATQF